MAEKETETETENGYILGVVSVLFAAERHKRRTLSPRLSLLAVRLAVSMPTSTRVSTRVLALTPIDLAQFDLLSVPRVTAGDHTTAVAVPDRDHFVHVRRLLFHERCDSRRRVSIAKNFTLNMSKYRLKYLLLVHIPVVP